MGTLANSEDPDEMPLNVAFHKSLQCLLKIFKKEIQFWGLIITCDPSIYTVYHSKLIVSNQKEESIDASRVKCIIYMSQDL